jgi:hypothetical protein
MVIQRRRSIVGPLLALLVVAAIVVGAVVIFAGDDDESAIGDVTVQRCAAEGDEPKATGQIVNRSSKTSNYVIRLEFKDPQGNQVSEGATAVKDVEAGETANWTMTGARDARGPLSCEVASVDRSHIPGQ